MIAKERIEQLITDVHLAFHAYSKEDQYRRDCDAKLVADEHYGLGLYYRRKSWGPGQVLDWAARTTPFDADFIHERRGDIQYPERNLGLLNQPTSSDLRNCAASLVNALKRFCVPDKDTRVTYNRVLVRKKRNILQIEERSTLIRVLEEAIEKSRGNVIEPLNIQIYFPEDDKDTPIFTINGVRWKLEPRT